MPGCVEDYVLFDCPGQVELFTHHGSLRNIFMRIQKMGYRVCATPSPPRIFFGFLSPMGRAMMC